MGWVLANGLGYAKSSISMIIFGSLWAILALIMHNLYNKSLTMHPLWYTKILSWLSLIISKTDAKFGIDQVCSFWEKVEQTYKIWVLLSQLTKIYYIHMQWNLLRWKYLESLTLGDNYIPWVSLSDMLKQFLVRNGFSCIFSP